MRIKLVPKASVESLKKAISENMPRYQAADRFVIDDAIDTKVNVPSFDLKQGVEFDAVNALTVYNALRDQPVSLLRDERMWVHMTHVDFPEYAMRRFSVSDKNDKPENIVLSRYFAGNNRLVETRNSVARLYHIGHVANRYKGAPIEKTLEMLTSQQGIVQELLERPEILQVLPVFDALIAKLIESYEGNGDLLERVTFREMMKLLNFACGSSFVEGLTPTRAAAIIDDVANEALPPSVPIAA